MKLVSAQNALKNAVLNPLVVDNKWYWIEDEGDEKETVRNRVEKSAKDIRFFLKLHEEAVEVYRKMALQEGMKIDSALVEQGENLKEIIVRYADFFDQHDAMAQYHGRFLRCPSYQEFNPASSSSGLYIETLALEGMVVRFRGESNLVSGLADFSESELGIYGLDVNQVAAENPSPADTSYEGRLNFVKKHLSEEFGFDLKA